MKNTNGVTKSQAREKEEVGLVDEEAEQEAQEDGPRNGQTEAKKTGEWEKPLQQTRQAQTGDAAWEDEPTDIEAEHNAQWQEHYVDIRAVRGWQVEFHEPMNCSFKIIHEMRNITRFSKHAKFYKYCMIK